MQRVYRGAGKGDGLRRERRTRIFDRLRKVFDIREERDNWFALYSADGSIDDATFCDGVERGNFRLHPKGFAGISQGCIVINKPAEFDHIAMRLRGGTQMLVPGLDIKAYGIVTAK